MKLYFPPRIEFDFDLAVWNSWRLVLGLKSVLSVVLRRVIYNGV